MRISTRQPVENVLNVKRKLRIWQYSGRSRLRDERLKRSSVFPFEHGLPTMRIVGLQKPGKRGQETSFEQGLANLKFANLAGLEPF